MATLSLADPSPARAIVEIDSPWQSPTLREWLGGDWGMLFSHPEDFEDRSLEQDRWLTIVREELHACGVKPLACATKACATKACATQADATQADATHTVRRDASWVGAVMGDWRTLRLDGAVADLPARQLRADIAALRSRFVLLVDAGLRPRGALPYRPGCTRLSPLDLTASVTALRRHPLTVAPRRAARAA